MKNLVKSLFLSTAAMAALLGAGASAYAAAIPYPNPGVEAPANVFTATNTGVLQAYFYGTTASYDETLGIQVNGVTVASGLFPNHATAPGTSLLTPIAVMKGDTLTFFINVATTGDTFSSDPSQNSDGANHAYATAYSGGFAGIPAGTYVGFEDLRFPLSGGQPNYDDETFVFTNTSAMTNVPLPASAPLFGAALVAMGVVGFAAKRKKAATAA